MFDYEAGQNGTQTMGRRTKCTDNIFSRALTEISCFRRYIGVFNDV